MSKKSTAIYVRVSTRDQSHASQLPDLERWTDAHDESVIWFRDKFTGKTMERPGMTKLLDALHSRKLQRIVVWRLAGRRMHGYLLGLAGHNRVDVWIRLIGGRVVNLRSVETNRYLDVNLADGTFTPVVPNPAPSVPVDPRSVGPVGRIPDDIRRAIEGGWTLTTRRRLGPNTPDRVSTSSLRFETRDGSLVGSIGSRHGIVFRL